MMSFKDFFILQESGGYGTKGGMRTVPIESEQFFDLYRKNCKLYKPATMRIYRGNHLLQGETYAYSDPSKASPRPSRNTFSFTMWLMENMEEWQKYPRRSQSLICSTTTSYAGSYGATFAIIPYDTAKIGACASMDFFDTIEKEMGVDVPTYNSNIYQFIEETLKLLKIHGDDKNIKSPRFLTGAYGASYGDDGEGPPATQEHFFSMLKSFDEFFLKHPEQIHSLSGNAFYNNEKIQKMVIDGLSNKVPLADILSQNLSPEKHGFELFDMNNFDVSEIPNAYRSSSGNEVWTDGPALFVKVTTFNDLVDRKLI